MPKNLIFLSDGTWDRPTVAASGNSNVVLLRDRLVNDATQVVAYDDVGATGNIVERLIEGAFGDGLFQKVKDGYSFFVKNYAVGDPIYVFGFSRGAYTARSIAGMVAVCGLPTQNIAAFDVNQAWAAYRQRDPAKRQAALDALNAQYAMDNAQITMVGVWDTVGSLGIPALFGGVDAFKDGFLDVNLHPDVHNAYQALAVDEARREFPATLWNPDIAPHQTLVQVWFAGVHTNVGGGEVKGFLSTIPLVWMMRAASRCGAVLTPAAQTQLTESLSPWIYDLITPADLIPWGLPVPRTIPADATVADSVKIRLLNDPTYKPSQFTPSSKLDGHPIEAVVEIAAAAGN